MHHIKNAIVTANVNIAIAVNRHIHALVHKILLKTKRVHIFIKTRMIILYRLPEHAEMSVRLVT